MNHVMRLVGFALVVGALAVDELSAGAIRAGDPETLLRERLGEPSGEVAHGSVRFLTYPGGVVTVEDGIVTDFPAKFSETAAQREKSAANAAAFAKAQQAKGLVFYEGEWMERSVVEHIERGKARRARRIAAQPRRREEPEAAAAKPKEPPRQTWQVQKKAPACGARRVCAPPNPSLPQRRK